MLVVAKHLILNNRHVIGIGIGYHLLTKIDAIRILTVFSQVALVIDHDNLVVERRRRRRILEDGRVEVGIFVRGCGETNGGTGMGRRVTMRKGRGGGCGGDEDDDGAEASHDWFTASSFRSALKKQV